MAHGKFISIYDLEGKNWQSHTQYVDDIMQLFSIALEKDAKPVTCIILDNGELYLDILTDLETSITSDKAFLKIEGKLLDTAEDSAQSQKYLFLFTKEGEEKPEVLSEDGEGL